jgi:hypothetical protein
MAALDKSTETTNPSRIHPMKKIELEVENEKLKSEVHDQAMEVLRLQAQAVLMGIALEDFRADEDQTLLAVLHGLIADYYKMKGDYHAYLREDINNADYR